MATCPFCATAVETVLKPVPTAIISVCKACMNPVVFRYAKADWQTSAPGGVVDVRQLTGSNSIGGQVLKALPEAIENLPVLPEIAYQIMELLRNPEMDLEDLVNLINEDPVIALRILKLANSPVYGGLTEIKDLRAACTRLGMRTIANAVQAIANGRLYRTSNDRYRDMMEDLWRHSVASAHSAGEIAALLAEPCADVHFVAGLVHDVGKVLLLDVMANSPSEMMQILRDSPDLFQEVLSQYHALVGLHIVHHWRLPPEFAITTFCHERPESVPDDSWLTLIHTVSLASAIANVSGFGIVPTEQSLVSTPSARFLGLNDIKLAALRIDIEDKIAPLLSIVEED